jgi:hypothetical protein
MTLGLLKLDERAAKVLWVQKEYRLSMRADLWVTLA